MKTIIFICHGNICRSPAAEFICKKLSNKYHVYSRATSLEEIGNDIYPPMKRVLHEHNVSFSRHYAQRISIDDYNNADFIFYMDEENHYSLSRMFGSLDNKILPIYQYTPSINEIEDPWYTGRYELVYQQIEQCIKDILKNID